ncbi:unnamed protein product, partial [Nippostrongylus brasiliensis]|uniref:Apt1 domain-containing protein n=1 Tax=Nippostrongylus brasiliensis TaxID=27835 RepID=A0A0N4XK04_NIPBR
MVLVFKAVVSVTKTQEPISNLVSVLSSSPCKGEPRPAVEKKSSNVVADDVKQEKPIVYYAITQGQPSSYRYFMRWRPSPMARSRRIKCVEDSEPISSETDSDEVVELNEFQHAHDRRLCLGDFISNQKQTYPVERRRIRNNRSSAPKAASLECSELELKKPFQLIDISAVSRMPSTFIHVDLNLESWANFNFVEQVDALKNVFTVRWLDVHYQRALVDVTSVLPWSKNTGELHLNTTTVSPKGDFDEEAFKTYINRCHLSDVRDLIGATIRLLEKWRKQTIPPIDGKEQLIQKKEYLPMFNAPGFPLAQRLTMDYMANILREETQRQHDQSSDAFDIITLK